MQVGGGGAPGCPHATADVLRFVSGPSVCHVPDACAHATLDQSEKTSVTSTRME
jgi:hypothetical protein